MPDRIYSIILGVVCVVILGIIYVIILGIARVIILGVTVLTVYKASKYYIVSYNKIKIL